jgi:hypothetical protein
VEHELPKVLDGVDEPVTVEELEAVVRRAGQRRRASLMAGAAGLLLVGAIGGAVVRGPGADRSTGFAGSPQDAQTPPEPEAMAGTASSPFLDKGAIPGPEMTLTSLFRRESNGVAIRAYRAAWGTSPMPMKPECAPPSIIHGELSNAAAVGMAFASEWPGDGFELLGAGSFGQQEGEPVTWATVRGGAGVSNVRLRLGQATDTMAPQSGITVLAVPGASGDGVVEGLDAKGAVVAAKPLAEVAHPAMDPACMPTDCMTAEGEGAGSAPPAGPAPTLPPDQPPAAAVPATPLGPTLDQAKDPAQETSHDPILPKEGFTCGVTVSPPGPGMPAPALPFAGSSGSPAPTTTAAGPATTDAPTSTATKNQAP